MIWMVVTPVGRDMNYWQPTDSEALNFHQRLLVQSSTSVHNYYQA
jgi:hypothetical protein